MTRTLLSVARSIVCLQLTIDSAIANPAVLMSLTDEDRSEIDRSFGESVLGESVPAPEITAPAIYLDMNARTRYYRVRDESGTESDQTFTLTAIEPEHGNPTWRYREGDVESGYVELEPDGSFVLTGVEDAATGAVTRYQPAEPFLLKGMQPGEERTLRMAVRVYDHAQPSIVTHEGALDVVYRYLGAFRLTLPAGTYAAVLMKSSFRGNVGPASLEDTQYRFFAPGAGLVASIERRDVSAFLVYNTHMKEIKLLATEQSKARR